MTTKLITKRTLLRGMFAAPAIVMIDNIMPIKVAAEPVMFRTRYGIYVPTPWFAPAGMPTLKNIASVVQW